MSNWNTQVWKADEWYGFFVDEDAAKAWIKTQKDSASYHINNTGPTKKERLA